MSRIACGLFSFALAGCFFASSSSGDDGDVIGGSRTVSGTVVDFGTGEPVSGAASVQTSGLAPAPMVSVNGAEFEIARVPDNSAFQILASAAPSHRATFSASIEVIADDLTGIAAPAVSEVYLASLATAFGVNPTAARGVLLARVVDAGGAGKAGVPAADFAITGGPNVDGPHFLDADRKPAPTATATSSSGWVVFFEVAPGVVSLGRPATATVTLDMAISPVNAGTITLAEVVASAGAALPLTNVSFSNQVLPALIARGCPACHSGQGPGRDLGGLTLNNGTGNVYKELVTEDPTRVRAGMPEQSLVISMPSREDPPDRHPNVTFTGPADPDYQKVYVWIKEGAKNN